MADEIKGYIRDITYTLEGHIDEALTRTYEILNEAKTEAIGYADRSQSYAVGGTGTREGEDTDNSKYYSELAEEKVSEVADVVEEFQNFSATAENLPADQPATALYSNGLLRLGIPKGDTGVSISSVRLNSDYTLTVTFSDGTSTTTSSIRGEKGDQGVKGDTGKGIESITLNSDYTLTVTYTDGDFMNFGPIRGQKGETGEKGDKGDKGDPGEDYILTQRDLENIASLVEVPDVIDDTAGDGDTDKTWSADKIVEELAGAGTVQDVQVNGTSVVNNGVAEIPVAKSGNLGVVKTFNGNFYGINVYSGELRIVNAQDSDIKAGWGSYQPITAGKQHQSTFYGLAKAAGDTTQSASSNAVGTYTDEAKAAIHAMLDVPSTDDIPEVPVQDVQVNGTSVVNNGVAEIPIADRNNAGVVKVAEGYGIKIYNGFIRTNEATSGLIKQGTDPDYPIVSKNQHISTFYGLAKAAGDTTQSASNNTVGNYTDNAKSAIKAMLGIGGETQTVQVSGTTPVITANQNTRYVCGEVATLDFTPSASGICDVIFSSGSTATVLTLPNTVILPSWFDATALEPNTTYEISISDGVYGAVMVW